jgi:hypothetical protein
MRQGWLGIVVGLTIGVAVVFVSQGGGNKPAARVPATNASELVTRCMAPLGSAYDRAATQLHASIMSEPAKALDAARGQVANVIQIRLDVCRQALVARRGNDSGSDAQRELARLEPFVVKLSTARARLDDLTRALSSPQPTDAQQKLDALDAAMRELTGSAGSAR